jgi:hypothetical protein
MDHILEIRVPVVKVNLNATKTTSSVMIGKILLPCFPADSPAHFFVVDDDPNVLK